MSPDCHKTLSIHRTERITNLDTWQISVLGLKHRSRGGAQWGEVGFLTGVNLLKNVHRWLIWVMPFYLKEFVEIKWGNVFRTGISTRQAYDVDCFNQMSYSESQEDHTPLHICWIQWSWSGTQLDCKYKWDVVSLAKSIWSTSLVKWHIVPESYIRDHLWLTEWNGNSICLHFMGVSLRSTEGLLCSQICCHYPSNLSREWWKHVDG